MGYRARLRIELPDRPGALGRVAKTVGDLGGNVLRLVVKQGMLLAVAGIGIGLGAAFAITRVLSSLLYGVSATDPATFLSISLILATVALAIRAQPPLAHGLS